MKQLLLVFVSIFAVFSFTYTTHAYTADDFVITVNTTLAGSASTTFNLPTTGAGYNFTVDWGDASTTVHTGTPGLVSHVYAAPGIYEIVITPNVVGGFPRIRFNGSDAVNTFSAFGDRAKILTVEQWGTNQWTSMLHAFTSCINLQIMATDSPDLSNVTSLARMFSGNTSMNQDISAWDVSTITDMQSMFWGAPAFNQPLNDWDVSSVTNMTSMFFGASAFNQPLDAWDVSSVITMQSMFISASSFNQPLNSWDISKVTNLAGMFFAAVSFNQPLNNWDVSGVIDMAALFNEAAAFDQDLSSWDVSNATSFSTSGLDIFENTALSLQNYTNILNSWSQLTVQTDLTFGIVGPSGDPTPYCSTAQAARDTLTNSPNNWIITDGGSTPCYTLSYSAGTNASLIGSGSQNIIAGEDGTEVTVVPDDGYIFIKWSDESTANPRTDLDVAGDITVTAVIEAEPSSGGGSSGTRIGVRTQNPNNLTTTSTPLIGNTDSVVDSVRALIERMKGSDEELKNLPPEEKKKLLLLLQAVVVQLLALLASL